MQNKELKQIKHLGFVILMYMIMISTTYEIVAILTFIAGLLNLIAFLVLEFKKEKPTFVKEWEGFWETEEGKKQHMDYVTRMYSSLKTLVDEGKIQGFAHWEVEEEEEKKTDGN